MNISLNNGFRGLVKSSCAMGIHWSHLDRKVGAWRGLTEIPLVVGYHRVVEDCDYSRSLSITSMLTCASTFEMHLDWIGKYYDFVSLDELALIIEGKRKNHKPVAAITFDDGYRDVYQNAVPILRRKGIPSAVFAVTDLVGTTRLPLHDELYLLLSAELAEKKVSASVYWRDVLSCIGLAVENSANLYGRLRHVDDAYCATRAILETLEQSEIRRVLRIFRKRISIPQYQLQEFQTMDWDMLGAMADAGVTVGSHTKSHVLLANESADVVQEELEGSRRIMEEHLGIAVQHLAYPDGSFNASTIAAAERAGYRTAHTICGHQDPKHPLLSIPRRMFWQNTSTDGFGRFSPAVLSCQVNGVFDPAGKCRRQHFA